MPPRTLSEFQDDPRARDYLDRYADPAGHFAFRAYDQTPVDPRQRLTASDVLMANLLGMRFVWQDITPLFAAGDGDHQKLRRALDDALYEARSLPALEDCTPQQAQMPALRHANELAIALPVHPGMKTRRWGLAGVSKTLHRLSRNIPIVDRTVRDFYDSNLGGVIRERMRQDLVANRAWMAPLATWHQVRGKPLPLTRMADILIWMDARTNGTPEAAG